MELKDRLQLARKRAGLKQAEVARAFDVTSQAVSQWERGEAAPELEKILRLARLYDVALTWLLKVTAFRRRRRTSSYRPAPNIFGGGTKVFSAAEGGPAKWRYRAI